MQLVPLGSDPNGTFFLLSAMNCITAFLSISMFDGQKF